jgi:NADH:ubiquinone oxidoreductase subunit D
LRGNGVVWDIRKAFPYSGYQQFDFDIPVGSNGDVYDGYLVRMLEQARGRSELIGPSVPLSPVQRSQRYPRSSSSPRRLHP